MSRRLSRRQAMGLLFRCSRRSRSIDGVMRELARATAALGLESGATVDAGEPGHPWAETSLRGLPRSLPEPFVTVTWGPSERRFGARRVELDVGDSWNWAREHRIDAINARCQLLCVPAPASRDDYERAGVRVPIEIVPLGVDTRLFRPWGRDDELLARADWADRPPPPGCFLFLVAGYLQPRKNMPLVLDAFAAAFSPDEPVALLVKTVRGHWGRPQDEVVAAGRQHLPVGFLADELDDWSMARLLASADCLVNAHLREGFGLMPLQAMACGTPPIVTRHDGPASYATVDNAILIEPHGFGHPGKEVAPDIPLVAGPTCAVVDHDALVTALRTAYNGGATARREAATATAAEWTWRRSAERLCEAIEQHVTPLRRRPTPQPPARGGLSVLIPCRNSPEDLARTIDSVGQTRWDGKLEVLVLDDASTPPLACAEQHVRIIRSDEWLGEGESRTRLLYEASGEWLFITDADVEFCDPDWAVALREFVGQRATVAHPLVLKPDGTIWSAGGRYRDYPEYGLLPADHRLGNCPPSDDLAPALLPYAPTVGWFARRELLLAHWHWAGGFFPTIFADVDLAFWLRAHGIEFWFAPVTRIVHHAGSFTARQSDHAARVERFARHADEFLHRWEDLVEHDLTTPWRCEAVFQPEAW